MDYEFEEYYREAEQIAPYESQLEIWEEEELWPITMDCLHDFGRYYLGNVLKWDLEIMEMLVPIRGHSPNL